MARIINMTAWKTQQEAIEQHVAQAIKEYMATAEGQANEDRRLRIRFGDDVVDMVARDTKTKIHLL